MRPDEYLYVAIGVRELHEGAYKHHNRNIKVITPVLQTQDSLDGGEQGRDVEGLEKDLCGCLTVLHGVQWCFSQQDRVLYSEY